MMRPLLALAFVLLLVAGAADAARPDDAGQGNGNSAGANAGGNGNSDGANAGGNGNGAEASSTAGSNGGDAAPASDGPGQGAGTEGPASQGGEAQATHGPAATPPGQEPPAADDPSAPQAGGDAAPVDAGAGTPPSQGNGAASPGEASSPGHAGSQDAVGSSDAPAGDGTPSAPGATLPEAAATNAPAIPVVHDVAGGLMVVPSPVGNRLAWDAHALPDGAQVQVWRQAGDAWVPVATVTDGDSFVDALGTTTDSYRLTWSQQPIEGSMLATIATSLPMVEAAGDGWSSPGRWLAMLLLGAVGAVGLVRATMPRRIIETRVQDNHDLLTALAGLPGTEPVHIERLVGLGLRTVGQLRRLDPDAIAFWANVPGDLVRRWQRTVELLQWPALPPGAAERLALAGNASLAALADATPAELLVRLRETSNVEGPGLPADEAEVAGWVAEARLATGAVPAPLRMSEAAEASRTEAQRPERPGKGTRFTWPTAATP